MLTKRILPIFLCLNIALLLFFIYFNYQIIFHSDSAVKNLLALEIYETGQYFPRDWNYINNDLWVFYTHTFILPLLGWMRDGFAAHAFSDLVSAALILGASWRLTAMLEQSPMARLTSMVVISSGMSLIMAEHIFGQAAYGSMYYMACLLVLAYWSLLHADGRSRWAWAAATAILTTLVFWANPQRAAIYYGLPLLTAALALYGVDRFRPARQAAAPRGQLRWLWLLAAATVAGVALHRYTVGQVHMSSGLTVLHWLDFNGIVANLLATVRGFLNLFDGLPRPDSAVVSLYGAYQIVRLLAALALLVMLPWAVIKSIQPQQRARLFFAVFTLTAVAVNLIIVLTTTLADMTSPEGSARYLVPSLLGMLILLVGVVVDRRVMRPATRAIGIAAIAILGSSGPVAYTSPYTLDFVLPPAPTLPTGPVRLVRFLQKEGLEYGYSPFWSAGKMTVLSGQRVRIRQIQFEHGLPMPMRMLSSNRWYRPEAWRGPTFLLLRDPDLKEINEAFLAGSVGAPLRKLDFEDWHIWVFAANIATLPGWDLEARTPDTFRMDGRSPHLIGKLAGTPAALVAEHEEYGPLYFGPARGVEAGSYTVTFDIETQGEPHSFGSVDVVGDAGKTVFGRQNIDRPGRQAVAVRFRTASAVNPLEFRVIKDPGGRMMLYSVTIQRDTGAAPAVAK